MVWLAGALLLAILVVVLLNSTRPERAVEHGLLDIPFDVHDARFVRLLTTVLGPSLALGNRIEALANGARIFPAMLAAIATARRTICFETYIYWSGEVGRRFTDALCERARAGVRVHVVLDGVGAFRLDHAQVEAMRAAGAEIAFFHPPRLRFFARLNHRTHRKLLIVDGAIGFTGGVGIADQWDGDAEDADHWRDVHFRVEGPVVAQMQAVFLDNWLTTRRTLLHGDDYFPALAPLPDGVPAQMMRSAPDQGAESVRLMYLLLIACARREVLIANAYFVPDRLSRAAIAAALARGVRVRILVPGEHIDMRVARRASRAAWGALLRAGAEIHEYQDTMFHCKVMVVDGRWTSIGSTNFDNRSFRLNDECNLNVDDPAFAAEQAESFARDLARSRRVTLADWLRRPWREKAVERLAWLVRSQV